MKNKKVKDLMKEALVNLLNEKYYLDITVTDVVKKAGVARASFYRTYKCVDDILTEVLNEVKNVLVNKALPLMVSGDIQGRKSLIKEFFNMVKEKKIPFMDLLPDNRQIILGRIENFMSSYRKTSFTNIDEKYKGPINLSIILTTARVWSAFNYEEDIDELIDYIFLKMNPPGK